MSPTETAPPVEHKTAFQQWQADPEPVTESTPAAEPETASASEPATETDPERNVDPEDQFEKLPRWARKELRKLRETNRELKGEITARRETVPEAKPEVATPPARVETDGKPKFPKLADFDTYESYETAMAEYPEQVADWKLEQREKQAAQRQATEAADARESTFLEQIQEVRQTADDWADVVGNPKLQITGTMINVMKASENGAKMLYHLGKNPDTAAAIAAKPTAEAQALALGKLEAKLFPEGSTETKPVAAVTKAPKPPAALPGVSGSETAGKEPDPKDFRAWNAWKDRQERLARQ